MARGRTAQRLVTRYQADQRTRVPDDLIVEEPLSIHLDDTLVATTMRTPGEDFELAVGYCFTEGLLGGAPVAGCRYCATGSAVDTEFNVVSVDTGGRAPAPLPRLTPTSSSCGLCGTQQLDELGDRLTVLTSVAAFRRGVVLDVPGNVRAEQVLFSATGGVHAAAAFTADGTPIIVREDIGRHNAVDKVVGRLVLDGALPTAEAPLGLFVSGRASYELALKAWAAGFSILVAVSAPSALAVQTAERGGLALVGFTRDDQLNLYCGALVD